MIQLLNDRAVWLVRLDAEDGLDGDKRAVTHYRKIMPAVVDATRRPFQRIRPLECVRPNNLHLPSVIRLGTYNRNPPTGKDRHLH